ncbi:bifunctional DNA primase/polymerase [Streptomyces sp. URMC 129]|uniref:bifunctional DNA primase/polymerase n=1 Tax=Streptomyces sp. URMC 129 TaxID=3423407 RepID=UPI003F1B4EEB
MSVEAAVELATWGVAVFPLPPGGRVPERGWQRQASADPEHVRAAWPSEAANVGVACRASGVHGLVVLDIDGDAGEQQLRGLCRAAGEPWPATALIRTPHGWHLYLWAPPGVVIPSTSGPRSPLGPAIDVRGPGQRSGGYVVGPGSTVAGETYVVQLARPIVPLPRWLVQHLTGTRPAGPPVDPVTTLANAAARAGLDNTTVTRFGSEVRVLLAGEDASILARVLGLDPEGLLPMAVRAVGFHASGSVTPAGTSLYLGDDDARRLANCLPAREPA